MTRVKFFRSRILLLISLIILFSIFASRLEKNEAMVEETRLYMGTFVQIKVSLSQEEDRRAVKDAIEKAFEEIGRVENVFSVFREDSAISKINKLNAGETLKINDEIFDIIAKSIEYNEKTKGAFDITVKPLVDLWARCKDAKRLPDDGELKDALARTGSQYIVLDKMNKTVSFKKEGMALDLGGVAKGYATDQAIRILKERGISNAIVDSGGDTYCLGRKSKDELWKIGIQHPRNKGRLLLEIKLENKAVDTSGDYEKYFLLNGKRYSHIIDPRTGSPIGDEVVSATVIAENSTTADILATSLCILGREGLKMTKSIKDLDAIIVLNEKGALKIETTEGLMVRLRSPSILKQSRRIEKMLCPY